MELTNEFRVNAPIDRTWGILTDLERIAPCMPGAQLQEIEGDQYRGVVKVKVGPITAQYKGVASFVEQDETNHRAVLRAEGRETRGQGNANATITAALVEDGGGTRVTITTDLTITGRVAQFGRGVLSDVSEKLLGQFVQCLESDVLADDSESSTPAAAAAPDPAAAAPDPAAATEATPATSPPEVPVHSAPAAPAATEAPAPTSPNPTSPSPAPVAGAPATGSPATGSPATGSPATGSPAAGAPATAVDSGPGGPTVRKIESRPTPPVNLVSTAGAPVARRAAPVVALVFLAAWLLRRRSKRRG